MSSPCPIRTIPKYSVTRSWYLHLFKWYKISMLTFERNRGELAEGWYDPATLRKAAESFTRPFSPPRYSGGRRPSADYMHEKQQLLGGIASSDDENIGPALPENQGTRLSKVYRSGPTIPSLQDLELRRGGFPVLVIYVYGCRELADWLV